MNRPFRYSRYALGPRVVTLATLFLLDLQGGAGLVTNSPMHLAVLVEGNVSVKEKGWSNFAPVVFGTALQLGDLLRLEDTAHAKIICSDLTLHDLQPGLVGIPCAGTRDLLRSSEGSLINATRNWSYDGSYPLVLSPRKTKLLSRNPILRWNAVPGAKSYRIIVRSPKSSWSDVVTTTQTIYPDSAPELQPGTDYKLIVETKDQSSSSEPGLGLGFSLLDRNEAKAVTEQEARINKLGLETGTTAFLIAHLYASHEMNAEAIDRLEALAKDFKAAAVERLLADLYMRVGLPRQAETCYLKSVNLSKDEKDEVGEMKAHLALARIYEQVLGNPKAASEQLNVTLELANKIGDNSTADQAGLLLAEVKKGGP